MPAETEPALVLEAPIVVDRQLHVVEKGIVVVENGRTAGVGTRETASVPQGARTIRLEDQILLPGLVNAHCHLDYTAMKGKLPADGGFTSWIARIRDHKLTWNDADYRQSIERGAREAVESGTTLLANITCVPHLIAGLSLKPAPRLWWFAEAINVGKLAAEAEEAWKKFLEAARPLQKFSLSPHALYTVSAPHFKKILSFCDRFALPWTTHVAESSHEWEMFHDAKGPLHDLLRSVGRDMSDCGGGATPFGRLSEIASGYRTPAILAHMNELSDGDLARLARQSKRLSVVHCPRSHAFFAHRPFRLKEMLDRGVNLCLGTDSLASNEDLNLFSEMRALRRSHPDLPAAQIMRFATINGARALGEGLAWGSWADWIALPARDGDPFDTILQFANSPTFVMISGQIVHQRP